MASEEEVIDTAVDWQLQHIRSYVETDGKEGYIWRGVPTLLLTTRGSLSGKLRRTPLIYGVDAGRYVVVGSKGGAPRHPSWYTNLLAHPELQLQVGAERPSARARPAMPDEKPRLWKLMSAIWPDYDTYQARTSREIPVVLFERT